MPGVCQLEIQEEVEELKSLLHRQKTPSDRERVQFLYLLKSGQASSMQQAAELLGRHRVTLQKWARCYREGGIKTLLSHKPRTGRQPSLPDWAQKALQERLEQGEGFESYGAIVKWLETHLGLVVPYKTVHQWVHYRLKAGSKIVRAQSIKGHDRSS